eukprot:760890-Hanusia_phi.AAC.1
MGEELCEGGGDGMGESLLSPHTQQTPTCSANGAHSAPSSVLVALYFSSCSSETATGLQQQRQDLGHFHPLLILFLILFLLVFLLLSPVVPSCSVRTAQARGGGGEGEGGVVEGSGREEEEEEEEVTERELKEQGQEKHRSERAKEEYEPGRACKLAPSRTQVLHYRPPPPCPWIPRPRSRHLRSHCEQTKIRRDEEWRRGKLEEQGEEEGEGGVEVGRS